MDDSHQCSPEQRSVTAVDPTSHPTIDTAPSLSVLYSFPHAIGAPGIGWTALQQVRALAAAGHRVTVVAASVAAPLGTVARISTTMTIAGHRLPHRAVGRNRAIAHHDRRAARMLAEGDYDVVHGWPWGSVRTFEQAARSGVASVREAPNTHTAHAFEVVAEEYERLEIPPPPRSPHTFNAHTLRLEEREWETVTAILVPSEAVRRSFVDKGIDPGKLLRHRYGALIAETEIPDPDPRDDPEHPFTAVYVGRIEPRKGLLYALQAWRDSVASEHGRFLVYGDFTPGYREVLGDLLTTRGVELRGFTTNASAVYADADVLILPTIEEGSALVTSEAQAAGCVPLVSDAAGANLEDGVQGLVHTARDVDTLRRHLDQVVTDPALLHRLRAAALAHRSELTWERAGVDLIAAYRDAIRIAATNRSDRKGA